MSKAIDALMEMPPLERLTESIRLLRILTCDEPSVIRYYRNALDLTSKEARIAHFFYQTAGRTVTREQIMTACWEPLSEADMKTIDVFICKLRKKLPVPIEGVWGVGYRLPAEHREALAPQVPGLSLQAFELSARPDQSMQHRTEVWTAEDDAECLRMRGTGSTLKAIAAELGRTERAVKDRLRHLKS